MIKNINDKGNTKIRRGTIGKTRSGGRGNLPALPRGFTLSLTHTLSHTHPLSHRDPLSVEHPFFLLPIRLRLTAVERIWHIRCSRQSRPNSGLGSQVQVLFEKKFFRVGSEAARIHQTPNSVSVKLGSPIGCDWFFFRS